MFLHNEEKMEKIYLYDNSFKKDIGRFWEDVTYMTSANLLSLKILKENILFIDNNYLELSKKYDLSNFNNFKKSLYDDNSEFFIVDFRVLCTAKNIFYGEPKNSIYLLPREIILFLLQKKYKIVKLNDNYSKNFDIILNIKSKLIDCNILPFKSFLLIETDKNIVFIHNGVNYVLQDIEINIK
jgi:hypothetical protein